MDDLTLTAEQEQNLLNLWNSTPDNPPGLKELTMSIFGQECDGRSKEGKAIKKALSKHNIRARPQGEREDKEITLTDEQKLYIANNSATMNSLEMARIMFANPSLSNLHAETRAVNEYVKSLDTRVIYNQAAEEDVPESATYEPPKTMDKVLRRVNKYVNFVLDREKLTPQQKKGLEMLINYLHTFRFLTQMATYESQTHRSLCEDAFIRYTYDKPDLTQEEVDQYIILANEVVQQFKIQRRSENLQRQLENITDDEQRGDETIRISMSLVEAIGKAQNEGNQCITRQQKLLDDLKEKRSTRLSKQVKDTASILNLVQMWKTEEGRQDLLRLAEKEQKAMGVEVDRLSSLPEIKARILGLSKEEILYG